MLSALPLPLGATIESCAIYVAFAGAAYAADPAPAQTIELKDGGKSIVEKQGTMIHLDAGMV